MNNKIEADLFGDLQPLDVHLELMMAELFEQIEETNPAVRQASSLRKMVAPFGDIYFFYNQTGDFCILTDFLRN